MTVPPRRRRESWVVGSAYRPATLTLVAMGAAAGTLHTHRDLGSLLAASFCVAFTLRVWSVWRAGRRESSPDLQDPLEEPRR